MIITIDGPAASGKSSVACCLAKKLNYYYLSSGLLYRACAYVLSKYGGYTRKHLHHLDPTRVEHFCNPYRMEYRYAQNIGARILFDGIDITSHLKSARVDDYASLISTDRAIRVAIDVLYHALGTLHDLVADGRDMGTVVFPKAEIKIFLTASLEVRAERWLQDQKKRGHQVSLDEAKQMITERDHRDTIRKDAPLAVAPDAHMIDNSVMTQEETCNMLEALVRKAL